MLCSRLEGRGGDGVRSGDQALPDLKVEYNVLSRIEEREFSAVCSLEPDRLRRPAGGLDLRDHKLDRTGMPGTGYIADRICALKRGRSRSKGFQSLLCDAGGSADVFNEILYLHLFASFAAMSSSTFFAAFRPLVTAGPIPLPEMAWAPANSRPSMKRSASAV